MVIGPACRLTAGCLSDSLCCVFVRLSANVFLFPTSICLYIGGLHLQLCLHVIRTLVRQLEGQTRIRPSFRPSRPVLHTLPHSLYWFFLSSLLPSSPLPKLCFVHVLPVALTRIGYLWTYCRRVSVTVFSFVYPSLTNGNASVSLVTLSAMGSRAGLQHCPFSCSRV